MACGVLAASAPAHGAEGEAPVGLYDGEAVGLIYAPLVGGLALHAFGAPPPKPRLFSADEGGATPRGDTAPTAAVGVIAGAGLLTVGTSGGSGQALHFKGLAESLSVTLFLTQAAKVTFGRHRPDHRLGASDPDGRRAFLSGHASVTLATTTYLALYLDGHVWPRWRAPGARVAWWEVLPLAALAGLSVAVSYSRVVDRRHHVGDVLAGAALGVSSSLLFYGLQQRRAQGEAGALATVPLRLLPLADPDRPGVALAGRF